MSHQNMQTQSDKTRARHLRTICNAVLNNKLPECAMEWPIVELARNPAIFGGGESAQFGVSNTLRIDGKHVERKRSRHSEYAEIDLPSNLAFAGKTGRVEVYVQFPAFIPES